MLCDEDMKPMDMTMIVKYKVSSFLYLYNDFLVQFTWFHPEGVVHVLEACSYLGQDPKGEY